MFVLIEMTVGNRIGCDPAEDFGRGGGGTGPPLTQALQAVD